MNKRLFRSRDERMVAGVCGGIADYFAVDPTIVRLLFLLLAAGPLPGILIYIVMAVVIPERTTLSDGMEEVPLYDE